MASAKVEPRPNGPIAASSIGEPLILEDNEAAGGSVNQSSDGAVSAPAGSHEAPLRKDSAKDGSIAHKKSGMQDKNPAPTYAARGPQEKNETLGDGNSIADASPSNGANQAFNSQELTNLEDAKEVGFDFPLESKESEELKVSEEDHRDEDTNEPDVVSYSAANPVIILEEGESSQPRRDNDLTKGPENRNIIDGEGAPSETILLDESLPAPVILKSTAPKKRTVWLDLILIFLWFLCCLILVTATFIMARRLDWNLMSIITAVPIFDHPEGIFQYLAMPLTLSQAKSIDFAVSAIVAPLLIAYANYVWFRIGRRLSNPEIEELRDTNADSTLETFDTGTYDLGKLTAILKRWTSRNILFVILLVSSALASTLLCNSLAYRAIPGSEDTPKDDGEMYYHMVYIPALLFFALCNITIASIVAFFLVFSARKAIEKKQAQLAANEMGVTVEEYNTLPEIRQTNPIRYFFGPFPTLPGFSLPSWHWWRQSKSPASSNAGELQPLLPVSELVESTGAWRPLVFPNWRLPGLWKYPRREARSPTAQDRAPEMSVNSESAPSVPIQRISAGPSAPWKFRLWKFRFPDLSISKPKLQMSEPISVGTSRNRDLESMPTSEPSRLSVEPIVQGPIATESSPLLNSTRNIASHSSAPNFKVPSFKAPKFNWPGIPSLDWGQNSDPECSHTHVHTKMSPKASVPGIESSRGPREPINPDTTTTELSPLLNVAKKATTSYNPARNFKLPDMSWFGLPSLDWGQHSDPECSHVVHPRSANLSRPSNSEVVGNPVNLVVDSSTENSMTKMSTSWNLPNLQLPHFGLATYKNNVEDLESQVAAPNISKGKEVERHLPEGQANVFLPKQTTSWGLPRFGIAEIPASNTGKNISATETHHRVSKFTTSTQEEHREDTTERSKWNGDAGVDWAVQWIDSNETAEKTRAFRSDAARPGLGSGWVSQQGIEWTSEWAGQNIVDFERTLPGLQSSKVVAEEYDTGTSTGSKSTSLSQTRTVTTSSKVLRTSESSNSRGWAFGGMDLPSLKGSWSREGQSKGKRHGKTKEVATLPATESTLEQSRPGPTPIINEKSRTSYSWGHPHNNIPTISGKLTSGGKSNEGSFSGSHEPEHDAADDSQYTTSRRTTTTHSGTGNDWDRWNPGWANRGNMETNEDDVRITKVITSTEYPVSTSSSRQVLSSNKLASSSTTSASQGHNHKHHHHLDHHHHHHHHNSQNSKSIAVTPRDDESAKELSASQETVRYIAPPEQLPLPISSESSQQQSWNEWGWTGLGRDSQSKKVARPNWDFGEWGDEE